MGPRRTQITKKYSTRLQAGLMTYALSKGTEYVRTDVPSLYLFWLIKVNKKFKFVLFKLVISYMIGWFQSAVFSFKTG